jgi:hypothetical protein
MTELIYRDEVYAIVDAAIEVYNVLGAYLTNLIRVIRVIRG